MLTVHDDLSCTPEAFWELYFSDGFQERLYLQGLDFVEFELLSHTRSGDRRDQRLRLKPPGLPRVVEKAMGETRYVETGRFDGRVWHFEMQPGGDRIRIEGRFWVDPTPGGCRRTCEVDVQVRIFGVGKAVAKALEVNVAETQAKAVDFIRRSL
jgi:hypothetical protein